MNSRAVPLACLLLGSPVLAHDAATARYLGNEGVLFAAGEAKVLFDAFYRNGFDQYALIDPETEAAMRRGAAPFDGVDVVLVSHVHGDHFTAAPVIAYLQAQPQVMLYGSAQVRQSIAKALAEDEQSLLMRVVGLPLRPGDGPTRFDVGAIQISVVAIPHAGAERHARITNLAFSVQLNGEASAIHLGDADANDKHFAPLQAYWDQLALNIAFPPYWFYRGADGRRIIEQRLKADQTVGIHVPARAAGNGTAWRQQVGGDLFTDPGEQRQLTHPEHE